VGTSGMLDNHLLETTSTGRSDTYYKPQGLTAVANGNIRKKTN
jgi:hypothetical protein